MLIVKLLMEINNRGSLPLGVFFCICYLQLYGGNGESPFSAIALANLWFKI